MNEKMRTACMLDLRARTHDCSRVRRERGPIVRTSIRVRCRQTRPGF